MREVLIWNKAKRLRVAGLIRKETRQVVRDPSSILVAAVLPLILIFLFGYGVTFDPRFFTIGLVVEQPTPEAGSFTAALSNSPYFRIQTARDRRSFEQDLVAGDLHGIVTLPASCRCVYYDEACITMLHAS